MNRRWIIAPILLLSSIGFSSLLLAGEQRVSTNNPDPAAAGATVTISNFQFSPRSVRVKAGSDVTWEVKEGTHTVNADNGSFGSAALSAGQKFSHTFATPGTYRYYCSFHGSKGGHDMAGVITVTK